MKKLWIWACSLVLLAFGITWQLWQHTIGNKTVKSGQPGSFFDISEWHVGVPISVFGDTAVNGYLVGSITTSETKLEGLVFLDEPLPKIQQDLGTEAVNHAKQCLAYYRGLYRQTPTPWNESTTTEQPPPIITIDGYEYRSMTPQATCKTDPNDNSLDDFDSHVVSGINTDTVGAALIHR